MSATERQRAQLMTRIGPVVARLGYELDGVSVSRVGRRALVRVTVDSDTGVDLDAIADVSRSISAVLDADDPFDTPFVLEVSSPGIDRPLTEPQHWRRNVGRLVQTSVGARVLSGRIETVDDDGVLLCSDQVMRRANWADLGPGRIQVDFSRGRAGAGAPADPHTDEGD